uniref:C2H2-type domain-containing protein n=1 Tax=Steinernema glaseri TaxID=37863 RepID=A0A1I8AR33_9BILA
MLERSQTNLEGSLANLERSLAIESTLSRLVEAQEELRRLMMDFINGTDIPLATPTRSDRIDLLERDLVHPVKREEEEGDQIERTDLPPRTPASPVERDEEDDINSEEEMDLDDQNKIYADSACANVPEGEERIRPGCSTHKGLPVPNEGVLMESQESEDVYESDEDTGSMSFGNEVSSGGEIDHEDSDMPGTSDSANPSATKKANSERLAIWKCVKCGKIIRGAWYNRQHHIESHEILRLFCPVAECSAVVASTLLSRHLKMDHNTTRSFLTLKEDSDIRRQLEQISQKAMECEMKYFPPSSLVSFAETSGRISVNTACRKCGKFYAVLHMRRDHVGAHLKAKFPCPFRHCSYSGNVAT